MGVVKRVVVLGFGAGAGWEWDQAAAAPPMFKSQVLTPLERLGTHTPMKKTMDIIVMVIVGVVRPILELVLGRKGVNCGHLNQMHFPLHFFIAVEHTNQRTRQTSNYCEGWDGMWGVWENWEGDWANLVGWWW